MSQGSLIYLINLTIGAILASLLLQYWRRAGRDSALGFWMLAAWTMTAADLLFALRPQLPYWVGRFFPTLLITVGHAMLLLGAERLTGRSRHARRMAVLVAAHGVALAGFLALGGSSWRTVTNGVVWGGLSIGAFALLRGAEPTLRRTMTIPAYVFLAHGLFHTWRIASAIGIALAPAGATAAASSEWVQLLGDVEASFFMVALFVSVLLAHLELRNQALERALADVHELSGLLPLCAWCRKVRNDDGFWQQIESYLSSRSEVQFTHGICEVCAREHLGAGDTTPPTPS